MENNMQNPYKKRECLRNKKNQIYEELNSINSKIFQSEKDIVNIEKICDQRNIELIKASFIHIISAITAFIFIGLFLLNTIFTHTKEISETFEETYDVSTFICYTTATGKCYHAAGCGYLRKSQYETTVYQAKKAGYRSCSKCSPSKPITITLTKNSEQVIEKTTKNYFMPFFISFLLSVIPCVYIIKRKKEVYEKALSNQEEKRKYLRELVSTKEILITSLQNNEIDLCAADNEAYLWLESRDKLIESLRNKTLFDYANIPQGLIVNKYCYPVGTHTVKTKYIVYRTFRGKCFHEVDGCSYASHKISLFEAIDDGLLPCKLCSSYSATILPKELKEVHRRMCNVLDELKQYEIHIEDEQDISEYDRGTQIDFDNIHQEYPTLETYLNE